jgi:hypothetical protein
MSAAHKGKQHKPHTDETKQKISASKIGTHKGMTYEEIYGKDLSIKLKQDRSNSAKNKNNSGPNNPMYGKNHTAESKLKQSKSKLGKKQGRIWITHSSLLISIKILEDRLYDYVIDGWFKGRKDKQFIDKLKAYNS